MQKVVDFLKEDMVYGIIKDLPEWERFLKENGLEEVGADGVDTMSDGSIYKMIMDSENDQ